jgi:hypothetical protein
VRAQAARPVPLTVKVDLAGLQASKAATFRRELAADLEAVVAAEPQIPQEEFQLRDHVAEFE